MRWEAGATNVGMARRGGRGEPCGGAGIVGRVGKRGWRCDRVCASLLDRFSAQLPPSYPEKVGSVGPCSGENAG